MDITRKGMGVPQQPAVQPAPVVAERLSVALIRPNLHEATFKKSPYGRTAASQQRAKELLNPSKPLEPKKDEKPAESKEKYNRELNQKGFFFEQEIDGVTYRVSNVKGGSDNIKIHALDKKQQVIGSALFWRHQYQDGLESLSTQVDPAWQGKGIATNMYAVMRMLGVNIHPATHQSDDGKKMWDKWRKNGDAKHIKSMNAKMTGVAEQDSPAMAHMAKSLENPPKVMQHRARRDQERDKQWMSTQIANNDKTSKDEWGNLKEKMMPASNFAGTPKNKLGSAAHLKGKMKRPARAGDLVGGGAEESVQHGIKVSEGVENIMDSLINKIIANEAIQNNK
jgi:hypothetical protein